MEITYDFLFVRKYAVRGVMFKSGSDYYIVIAWDSTDVYIRYHGLDISIPYHVLYKALLKDNLDLVNKWKHEEAFSPWLAVQSDSLVRMF